MKRIHLLILMAFFSACSLSAQKTTLSGTIASLPDGVSLVIGEIVGDQLRPLDTLNLDKSGNFKVTLNPTEPTLYILQTTLRDGAMCHLMLEPKEKVTVNLQYYPDQRFFRVIQSKGSRNVDLYRQFNEIITGAVNPTLQAMAPGQIEQLLSKNKNVLMSAFLVTFFEQDFESHAALYTEIRDALVKDYPNDPYVKHLSERLRGVLLPGMEAPDISMKDPDGNIRKLSDLRGKVVLLDFWASWCGPCRQENPNVVRLYKKYHDKGFEIYSVSLDKEKGKWLKAIKDDGLEWPNHVSDLNGWTSSGGKTYGIMSVPNTTLIDRDGKIIARNLRGSDLERKLQEIFGN
ncbi:MAG: AhpC/TSA family protein [Bacteroidales bacterium]|nr:AhpC/TSA family protein [Bacteroidales bacterium]MBR3412872.1 AhpC/TSA family protein [Bacteroidales bacterium]